MALNVVWSSFAKRRLENQIDYLIEHHAPQAARQLEQRVSGFVNSTLAYFPNNGRELIEQNMFETWIPGTRLVIWYRFTASDLEIINVWHTSQNRELD